MDSFSKNNRRGGWGPERVVHRRKFYAVGLRNDGQDEDLEFVGGYPYIYDNGTLFMRTEREDDRGRRIYEERA